MATLIKTDTKKSSETPAKHEGPFNTIAEASLAKNADLILLLKRFEHQIQYPEQDLSHK